MSNTPAPKHVAELQQQVRQLQSQIAGLSGGPSPSAFNGVLAGAPRNGATFNADTSMLWLETTAGTGTAGAITVKRTDATWGVTAGSPLYGQAQPFEILSPSTQDSTDTTDDGTGTGGQNPVLARIDAFGGFGTVQGIHISPGLRDTYGGGTPIGVWVQLINADTFGAVVSGPDPAKVPTPFSPLFQAQTYGGHKIWNVDSLGNMNLFASDGTTGVFGAYSGDTPGFGHRLIATAGSASTRVFGFARHSGQTAAIGAFLRSDGTTLLASIDKDGSYETWADNGTDSVAYVGAGDTPAIGIRSILWTYTPATVGLALKSASGQTADLLATYDHTGTKIATIIDHTGNLVGGSGSVPLILSASTGFLIEGQDSGTTRMAVDYLGDILTYDDAGTTAMSNIAGGTTPGSGYRVSLSTGSTGTVGLGIANVSGQTAPLIQVNIGGTLNTIVDSAGTIEPAILALGGALVPAVSGGTGNVLTKYGSGLYDYAWAAPSGGGVSSFNGRTDAVSLTFTDCANAVSPSGFVNATGVVFGKVLTADGAGGYFWG